MATIAPVYDSHGDAARVARERRTIGHMFDIYCRAHHARRDALCPDCAELHAYAMARLDHCPFGSSKPTCRQCPVHCYRRDRREAVRTVMRFSGPRMLRRHPILAIRHLWDDRRPVPARPASSREL